MGIQKTENAKSAQILARLYGLFFGLVLILGTIELLVIGKVSSVGTWIALGCGLVGLFLLSTAKMQGAISRSANRMAENVIMLVGLIGLAVFKLFEVFG